MKKIFLLSLLAIAAYSCTPSGYVINGYVADSSLVDHNVYLGDAFSENILDTAIVASDGTFVFKGSIGKDDNPFLALVHVEYSDANSVLVLENGKIKIDFDYVDGAYIPSLGGTPMNDAIFTLGNEIQELNDVLISRLDSVENNLMLSQEEKEELQFNYIEEFKASYAGKCEEMFTANHNNAIGLYSLLNWSSIDASIDMDSIVSVSGEVISENPTIQQMAATARTVKATMPGKPYVDLVGYDASGNEAKLSQYVGKGKFVLIDFWASWCVPCKEEIPYLAELHKKYGDKVYVVGLNVWDNIEEFNRVCAEYKIVWPQIVDPSGQSFTDQYGVSGIPQIILISPDGTILARNLRGEAIAETIEKHL